MQSMHHVLVVLLISTSSVVASTKLNIVVGSWWDGATNQSVSGISLVDDVDPRLSVQNSLQQDMEMTPREESMQSGVGHIKKAMYAQNLMQQSRRMTPTTASAWSRWWLPCAVLVAMLGLVGSVSSIPLGAETLSQYHASNDDDAIAWKPTLGFQRSHKLSKNVDALVEDESVDLAQPQHARGIVDVALQQEVVHADTSESVPHESVLNLQRTSSITKRSGALVEDDHDTFALPTSQSNLNEKVRGPRPSASSHIAPQSQQSSYSLLGLQRKMHMTKTHVVTEDSESDDEADGPDPQAASSTSEADAMQTYKQPMGAMVLGLQRGYVVKRKAAIVEE